MALLADTYGVRGENDEAGRLADQALELTRHWGLEEHPPTNRVHVAQDVVALADGDVGLAEEHFERGGDACSSRPRPSRGSRTPCYGWGDSASAATTAKQVGRRWTPARELVPDIGRVSMQRLVQDLELELADHRPALNPPSEGYPLSEAELRVLRLLPGELSYREIGRRLHLSLNTVRTHASRLRRKLRVSTRSAVVSEAHRRGWL